jgi:O-antigen/teichoic acid export membrane protein
VGVFAAITYLGHVGTTVVSALGQAALPRLARAHAAGERGPFLGLVLAFTAIAFVIGAIGLGASLAFGRELLGLVYNPEYAAHERLFAWAMGAAAISYVASILGYSMTAAHCFAVQIPLFAAVAGATALACRVLVPLHGLEGAGEASVVSALVGLLGAVAINVHAIARLAPGKLEERVGCAQPGATAS